jgi:hypothetical protein
MTVLKWLSTTLFLCAGLILALNLPFSKVGFILFFIGHIVLLGVFVRARDWPMITQNGFFILIDLIGIYRWFL